MKRLKQLRTAAFLVLSVALAATTAFAEPGTVTITGTFTMDELNGTVGDDLAQVFANGGEHSWTLTLYGTTYSHERFDSGSLTKLYTRVYAKSFDFRFDGPDADVLNDVVGQHLDRGSLGVGFSVGDGALLVLGNATNSSSKWSSSWAEWALGLQSDPEAGVSFYADNWELGPWQGLLPADAYGYPVVGSDPLSLLVENMWIGDSRSGNSGHLLSWEPDGVVEITGDLGLPIASMLSIGDGSALEGSRGKKGSKLTLRVSLTNTSDDVITVGYRTVDGTAVANSDYYAASGTLTFQPGETVKTITVSIKADRNPEADEVFSVELFNATGATIEDGVGTATIVNDD